MRFSLIVCALLVVGGSRLIQADFQENYPILHGALKAILEDPSILEPLVERGGEAAKDALELLKKELKSPPEQGSYCKHCKLAVPALRAITSPIETYESARVALIRICKLAVFISQGRGYNTEALCPSIMDLYGPQVFPLVKNKKIRPETICLTLNVCYSTSSETKAYTAVPPVPDLYDSSIEDVTERLERVKRSMELEFNEGEEEPDQFTSSPSDDSGNEEEKEPIASSPSGDENNEEESKPTTSSPSQDGDEEVEKPLTTSSPSDDKDKENEMEPTTSSPSGEGDKEEENKPTTPSAPGNEDKEEHPYITTSSPSDDKGKEDEVDHTTASPSDEEDKEERPLTTSSPDDADNEREVIRIVQLADIHIDPKYAVGSPTDCNLPTCCHKEYEGTGEAWPFGTYTCNTPQSTLDAFLDQVAHMEPKPDFVIYTGDNPPHQMWDDETLESQLNCSYLVTGSIKRALGEYAVFSVIGNHEPHPTNLYSPSKDQTKALNNELADLWSDLAPSIGLSQKRDIRTGAYYTANTPIPGLRIIVVNTNFWYNMNFWNVERTNRRETRKMMTFIEKSLEKVSKDGEKVIMAIHHPPGQSDFITEYSQWYSDVIERYSDIIVLQVAGHTHNDMFKVFKNRDGDAIGTLFVAPSVTPRASNGGVNPSMRVYTLDKETHQLLNIHQHRMYISPDLKKMPNITYIYNTKELYNMTDLSPASFSHLVDRIATDDEVYELWKKNYNSDAVRKPCDAECKQEDICSLQYTSYEKVAHCMAQFKPFVDEKTGSPHDDTTIVADVTTSTTSDVTDDVTETTTGVVDTTTDNHATVYSASAGLMCSLVAVVLALIM